MNAVDFDPARLAPNDKELALRVCVILNAKGIGAYSIHDEYYDHYDVALPIVKRRELSWTYLRTNSPFFAQMTPQELAAECVRLIVIEQGK